ncbi:MAG: TrpB-like pyridoxal phosphate-dependent enzyme [Nitrospinae bacterium]|nr:TrpB-like pyridoxal phosphate-dependent enzyme [Nitrospinota bacterium]MBI3815311.1 TrpB-like pyridoxal phosphate-dependent enzyme [Nitrospinota bacterium]
MQETKVVLSERDLPKQWYNILPDMPSAPVPPIHPGTKKPIGPDDLAPIFPMNLIEQEVSPKNWIDIPEEVLNVYTLWRPTPLYRAYRLEKALNTPAKIYYKYEGVSPAGSHKPNTAVPQAYYNKVAGTKRIATETGAGQWGSAISMACKMFDLQCTVYMVRVSYNQKPYRRSMIETWGAEVHSSPSKVTQAGKKILEANPDSPGSLGIAISEAVEDAATHEDTKYSLGSVLNHVLLHQTVIGLELKKQFEKLGEKPDVLIACCGGGSNFGGFVFPFIKDKLNGSKIKFIAVEPAACPTLTKGEYKYDFGDTAQLTPLIKMYTLGHDFVPPGIHAGGLRYHGDSPLVSQLYHEGVIEAAAHKQNPVFAAAVLFAKSEGIIPAPESAHAIKSVVDEAVKCREAREQKVIAFNLSGHGNFDMAAYDSYLSEKLEDFEMPEEEIKSALARLPKVE